MLDLWGNRWILLMMEGLLGRVIHEGLHDVVVVSLSEEISLAGFLLLNG